MLDADVKRGEHREKDMPGLAQDFETAAAGNSGFAQPSNSDDAVAWRKSNARVPRDKTASRARTSSINLNVVSACFWKVSRLDPLRSGCALPIGPVIFLSQVVAL